MTDFYLRPGPWKMVYVGSSTKEIKIDNEVFEIPPGNTTAQTVEFEARLSCTGDDTNLSIYRNPVSTVVSTNNTGGSLGNPDNEKLKEQLSQGRP